MANLVDAGSNLSKIYSFSSRILVCENLARIPAAIYS